MKHPSTTLAHEISTPDGHAATSLLRQLLRNCIICASNRFSSSARTALSTQALSQRPMGIHLCPDSDENEQRVIDACLFPRPMGIHLCPD